MKKTIAIAGATGFIGRWFIEKYHQQFRIIALSRRQMDQSEARANVEWRTVELYSYSSTKEALKGADYALYLVHSMLPSARLTQGSFEDTDILLADNFARAAEDNQLKQIIFLGGILPQGSQNYSRHLRSRYEVEMTLSSRKTPLIALRAGIIVGPGGSSFRIIEKLVKRLPVLICPRWTQSQTQPISLDDTLHIIRHVIGQSEYNDQHFDIGGKEVTTYLQMMKTAAEAFGLKRYIYTAPVFSLGLSKAWVAFFANSSPTLVSPLVESLRYDLLATPNKLLDQFPKTESFATAAKKAIQKQQAYPKVPASIPENKERNTVRSVQRLPNPNHESAIWVANQYQTWLSRFFRYIVYVEQEGDISKFKIGQLVLLQLQHITDRSNEDRQLFYIIDGWLVKRKDYGWLEFRRVLQGQYFITAIHEYVPTLPWYIYLFTQAKAHLFVINSFKSFLNNHKQK